MNRPSKTKSLLIPLFSALTGIFAACSNSDYDFNEIDFTLGLGGDELIIPTSNTSEMKLDAFLTLEEGDCVQILENGEYAFVQEGSDVSPASPHVDPTTFDLGIEGEFDFNLDSYIEQQAGSGTKKLTRADQNDIVININTPFQEVLDFEYKAEKPKEIETLKSIDITTKLTLTATLSQNLFDCLGGFDILEWELPNYMIVDEEKTKNNTKGISNLTIVQGSGENNTKLILENVLAFNKDIELDIYLKQIDFTKIQEGGLSGDDTMEFKGKILLRVQTTKAIELKQAELLHEWSLTSGLTSEEIVVKKATGNFNPEVDLGDIGDIDVSNVPDFLKNDDVYIDLYNPQIYLEIDNNMDVAAEHVKATLTSIKNGKQVDIDIPGVRIDALSPTYRQNNPDATVRTTKICICLHESLIEPDSLPIYKTLVVPNLTDIFIDGGMPDRIQFVINKVDVDDTRTSSIELGEDYTIQPKYKILIPIAFGEKAIISYTDSIDNLQEDLDGIDFAEGSYLELTADVENKLPIVLTTEVIPLTAEGKDLSQSKTVTVKVEENIPGTKDENQPAKGTLKITVGGDIKLLDKLKFAIAGNATNELQGITLNNTKHSLKLNNVKMKLVGRIIYDAN